MLWLVLASLFLLAFLLRANHLGESRIVGERQFRSAILARTAYLSRTDSVEDWRREVASVSSQRAGRLEPPFLEFLVASVYGVMGGRALLAGGLFSALFWLGGGVALYRIARRITSPEAAAGSVAYYLFVPQGVVISVSFLPESLMVMMVLLSVLSILRHAEKPSRNRLLLAAIVSGLAGLVKPFCIFTVIGAFVGLWLLRKKDRRSLVDAELFVFSAICLCLSAAYYLYGIFLEGSLASNLKAGFLPHLFFEASYWHGWLTTAASAAGVLALAAGLVGFSISRVGVSRNLLGGMTVGYVVFGLVYTYPIAISHHYHVQLIVIVALALTPLIELATREIITLRMPWCGLLAILTGLAILAYHDIRAIERLLGHRPVVSPEAAREIGESVGHSTRVVYLARYYGYPLEYYAEISGTYWPRRTVNWDWIKDRRGGEIDQVPAGWLQSILNRLTRLPERRELGIRELGIQERFEALGFAAEYFVITDFRDFKRYHADLAEFLGGQCALIAESPEYLVYDIRQCV